MGEPGRRIAWQQLRASGPTTKWPERVSSLWSHSQFPVAPTKLESPGSLCTHLCSFMLDSPQPSTWTSTPKASLSRATIYFLLSFAFIWSPSSSPSSSSFYPSFFHCLALSCLFLVCFSFTSSNWHDSFPSNFDSLTSSQLPFSLHDLLAMLMLPSELPTQDKPFTEQRFFLITFLTVIIKAVL